MLNSTLSRDIMQQSDSFNHETRRSIGHALENLNNNSKDNHKDRASRSKKARKILKKSDLRMQDWRLAQKLKNSSKGSPFTRSPLDRTTEY